MPGLRSPIPMPSLVTTALKFRGCGSQRPETGASDQSQNSEVAVKDLQTGEMITVLDRERP